MRYLILIFSLSMYLSHAERVEWLAEGQVTSASGVFSEGEIAVGDAVSVELSYDEDAGFDQPKNIPFPPERDRDYFDEINLTMRVVIGDRTWEGSVVSGVSGIPETIFVRTGVFSARFEPLLREEELADFATFPLDAGAGNNTMGMNFQGNPPAFLGDGIDVDSIDPEEVISATGSITTGGSANTLGFSLDLDSIVVRTPVEPVEFSPLVLDLVAGETTVELSWQTDLNVSYQLQEGSSLDDDWTMLETISGTGDPVSRSLERPEGTRFYRLLRE